MSLHESRFCSVLILNEWILLKIQKKYDSIILDFYSESILWEIFAKYQCNRDYESKGDAE